MQFEINSTSRCQPRERCVALRLRRGAVDVLGPHAGLHEFVSDVNGVADTGSEGNGLPPFGKLVPMRDNIADQLRTVHALG